MTFLEWDICASLAILCALYSENIEQKTDYVYRINLFSISCADKWVTLASQQNVFDWDQARSSFRVVLNDIRRLADTPLWSKEILEGLTIY